MRIAIFLLAFSLVALAACATPSGPTYTLTVLETRGVDTFARIADFGLSADDCAKAAPRYQHAICEVEKSA